MDEPLVAEPDGPSETMRGFGVGAEVEVRRPGPLHGLDATVTAEADDGWVVQFTNGPDTTFAESELVLVRGV